MKVVTILLSTIPAFISVRPENMCKDFVPIAEVELVKLDASLRRRTYQSAPLARTLKVHLVHRWWRLPNSILMTEYRLAADSARAIGVSIDGSELIEVV